jgi:hypothetical protein
VLGSKKHSSANLKKYNKSNDFVAVYHSYLQTLPSIFWNIASLLVGLAALMSHILTFLVSDQWLCSRWPARWLTACLSSLLSSLGKMDSSRVIILTNEDWPHTDSEERRCLEYEDCKRRQGQIFRSCSAAHFSVHS